MSKLAKALTAAAGNAGAGESLYVEDVFSTYLYEGNGATGQSIVNGIDLSGEGGLVWGKSRDSNSSHSLYDTERGVQKPLILNTAAEQNDSSGGSTKGLYQFNSDGFTIGDDWGAAINLNGDSTVAWTFRKAEKFFDVVTWTGNGATERTFSHNLNASPNCVIIKRLDSSSDWWVWHSYGGYTLLNSTAASGTAGVYSSGNSTTFSIWEDFGADANINGATYVAYLFASDAGGFGDDGSESIIKCGSYTGNGVSGKEIDVGFEPQWVLQKASDTGNPWTIIDVMRGANGQAARSLMPNSGAAEQTVGQYNPAAIQVTATGFKLMTDDEGGGNGNGNTYIYIAIRRPMKTPESGTEVFDIDLSTTNLQNGTELPATPFATDMVFSSWRDSNYSTYNISRLTDGKVLYTHTTGAESSSSFFNFGYDQDVISCTGNFDSTSSPRVNYAFKRATGFFDVVAYTGDGVAGSTQSHNLKVVPELMIVKRRSGNGGWIVYSENYGGEFYFRINTDAAATASSTIWNDTDPTSSVFTLGAGVNTNSSGSTYIAYLFATLAGVSKVGSYTGNGTSLTVDCGFSNGARFVLIKRTNSAGMWMVFDTARGIVAGNDPVLYLNSTAAEFSGADLIDPNSSGFTVNWAFSDLDSANPNASGSTYIFLAIA